MSDSCSHIRKEKKKMNHTSRHIEKGAKYHLCHAVVKRKWGQALLAGSA